MTKPILWLGPLDEIDAEFDPLLGRSAKEVELSTQAAPSKPFAADRSVFDDPYVIGADAPIEPVTVGDPPIDFSHNNDVIPERLDAPNVAEMAAVVEPVPEETDIEEPEQSSLEAANSSIEPSAHESIAPPEPEPAARPIADNFSEATTEQQHETEKSFFTRLFTRKSVVPTAVIAATAPVSDAPAKAVDSFDEPKSDGAEVEKVELTALESQIVEPFATPEDIILSPPETELKTESEAEPLAVAEAEVSLDEAIAPTAVETTPEETDVEADPIVEPKLAAETEPMLEAAEHEPAPELVANEALSEPNEAVQEEASSVDPIVDEPDARMPPTGAETVEPESVPEQMQDHLEAAPELVEPQVEEIKETAAPVEATSQTEVTHPYSRAFNADRFWTIDDADDELSQPRRESAQDPAAEPTLAQDDTADAMMAAPPLRVGPDDRPIFDNKPPAKSRASQEPYSSDEPNEAQPQSTPRPRRRKKKVKKSYLGAFAGTLVFGFALAMTLVSSMAAAAPYFDVLSSYRWYWITLAVVSAGIWGLMRGWKMVLASFAVIAMNLFVTVPTSGNAPVGGKTANAVLGWANVKGSQAALARLLTDADAKKASLVMVAEAPASVLTPPAGWTLIEAPAPNDPTAIAVLSKGSWRAVTVPGEPTMARPPAGDVTIIGVHPLNEPKGLRRTPDALLNRAATRAGIQEGPTVVLGDFNASPWAWPMRQFREYGNVERVRCGGWAGATFMQVFGLIGVATDHAYVRDVKVTHCQLGQPLKDSNHKPIWLFIAPQAPTTEAAK